MGPPAEIVKPEEYEETTYLDLEIKLLKESVQGILFGVGITLFMSFKFNVHVSLIIQSVSGPLNLLDSLVLKKYLLGIDQDRLYGEFLSQPTIEDIASLAIDDKEPQVVPLKEEAEVAKAPKSTGSKCAEVPVKTSVNEIDWTY